MRMIALAARVLGAALLTATAGACAAHDPVPDASIVAPNVVEVEVFDRAEGTALPVYAKDGRRYVVGTPGHEYALRIRNVTASRVLVVTSVDGVNVISGDTAAPSQSGYVLDPWGSVEILGWRKSLERTAAFFFTDLRNSYAARTGRPANVGVIGVAAFRERVRAPLPRDPGIAVPPAPAPRTLDSREPTAASGAGRAESDAARGLSDEYAPRRSDKLGTGHGRNEASPVRIVSFERASDRPSQIVTIRYDRRENLVAMGVLPGMRPYPPREPEPFPAALRFAPDPAR